MKKNRIKRRLVPSVCNRFFRVTQLTIVLFLVGLMQVSASLYSSTAKLTLEMHNKKVAEVLEAIEQQSEFRFAYSTEYIDLNRKVSLEIKEKTIKETLQVIFDGTEIKYLIKDRHIMLYPKAMDIGPITAVYQQIEVTGTVSDKITGDPLPGVNIVIEGTTSGTTTDMDGYYSIGAPPDARLVFTFVGYQARTIDINGREEINISLDQAVTELEQVVAIGYGTQKKINLTGSVDVVSPEDMGEIENRSVTNVAEALQGISPNLNMTQTQGGNSSEPGGEMRINIRGVGSLTGDYSPYVLVDGVPMDLNEINPSDIESISVLKDAAASAIYGARAPYGVILITTKSGEDKGMQVEYSNNISFSSPIGMPHNVDALSYVAAHDQSLVNAGLSRNFSDENYERIRQYMAGELDTETWLKPDGSDWVGNGIWSQAGNGNNDWMYIYYDEMVMRQKHDLNVSGSGENSSYYLSAGYWDQPGELAFGDEYYKRYNLTANFDTEATDWLTVKLNSKYINEERQHFNTRQGWSRLTMYHNFFRNNPYRPLKLPNGEYSNISYIPMLNGGKENIYESSLILSLGMEIEPLENWVTRINYNYKDNDARTDDNEKTVYGTYPDESQYVIAYPISNYATTFGSDRYQMFNIITSYDKDIKAHHFSILAGYENELDQYRRLWGSKDNILTSNVPSISTSTGEYYLDDSRSHWSTQGIFGRFQYNYEEKYLVEVNARYDGSSRFEEGDRWGLFPSFSLGYNISKEGFWSSIEPYVNTLKLRGSWGSLGNQDVPNYLYLPNMGIGTQLYWIMGAERPNYTTAPGLVSADLTWETSTTTNVGLDVGFLNNRLNASFDIYSRVTTNMFGPAEALPQLLGTGVPQTNNATLKTRGFELVLGWKDNIGDVSYNIRANLADNVSTVVKYNNPTKTLSTWYEGQELGEVWGLKTVGIYQSNSEAENGPDQSLFYPNWGAGDIHYKDMDGDGEITRGTWTADDAGDYHVIGNNRPRYTVGLNTSVKWKGIDFNMFWQGVLKREYAFEGTMDMTFFGFEGHHWWDMNMWKKGDNTTLDYWRPADETNMLGPNTNGYYPKPYLSQEDFKNKQIQTRYMQSAAYMRLKSLNIGYTLPDAITGGGSTKARIFISGENLLTFTPLTKLIDPEALTQDIVYGGSGKVHFLRRVYALGINLTF